MVGITLLTLGVLLFLSFVRFTPVDFVDWVFLGAFAPDGAEDLDTQNWLGPIGAVLGFVFIGLFGVAAWLLAACLVWLGVAIGWFRGRPGTRIVGGLAASVVLGASLANVFGLMENYYHVHWAGGLVGEGIGQVVLQNIIGTAGATVLLLVAYLAAMIYVTGHKPKEVVERVRSGALQLWANLQARRAAMGAGAADVPVAPPAKKATRKRVKKQAQPAAAPDQDDILPAAPDPETAVPAANVPPPQIIDSSAARKPLVDISRPFERPTPPEPTGLSVDGYEGYQLPGFDLLEYDENAPPPEDHSQELLATQQTIIDTCKAFNVEVSAGDITRGPTITRYEIYPSVGLRVNRISQLEADLARATKAERINILAPIPGKDTVGIEIANENKTAVPLRELLQDDGFRSSKRKIPLALGKDVYGNTVIGDLAAMPHCLVAGATGAGKSVCINSIITSILYKFGPDELRFIMVDPKVVEMQVYADLPHLVVPVVTDPKKTVGALNWCVNEMERRYKLFAKLGVRNFDSFNARVRPEPEEITEEEQAEIDEIIDDEAIESMARAFEDGDLGPVATEEEEEYEEVPDKLPYIVIIIDELADLMQTAPADIEVAIGRIAQKARAAGIHLIVATQTPRADVVTGMIKANIPSRIAFQVSSALDSRVILDSKGAEKLVGKGDMLFLPPGSAKLERAQGAFVSDQEVEDIVSFCANQTEQRFEESIQQSINAGGGSGDGTEEDVSDADEETLQKCVEVLLAEGKASTSMLQRRLRLGYTRAARMIDILEARGVVGPADGARPREVLIAAAPEPVGMDPEPEVEPEMDEEPPFEVEEDYEEEPEPDYEDRWDRGE